MAGKKIENIPEATADILVESGGEAQLALSGKWVLSSSRTTWEQLRKKLESSSAKMLKCDCRKMSSYDSALVCLLLNVYDFCSKSGINFDISTLPDGPRKLLQLAVAVPENESAKREGAVNASGFLYGVGTGAMEGVHSFKEQLEFIGQTTIMLGRAIRGKIRYRISDLMTIIQRAGPDALGIVCMISFLVGLILAFVGAVQLAKYGSEIFVADLVGIAMVREMGAIMVGIVMSGRTGAAFAAELGSMKVNEEIDAFSSFGISPMDFLVFPRMAALVCMFPLLTVFADVMGMLGGMVIGIGLFDLNYDQYWNRTCEALTITQCSTGVLKSVIFGIAVALIGCMKGMKCGNSSAAVGLSTTASVVASITAIVVIDAVFAVAFNIFGI